MQSDLFNVQEVEKENEEKKQKEHEEKNLAARKQLVIPYFDNPQNDNEMLFNYQYEYIKNNSEKAWGDLITLSFKVTKRLVWLWMKKNKLHLDAIEQDEKTSIAVEYVLRRYKKNIGYCINKNFISALKEGVKHAMLYTTKIEINTTSIDEVYFKEEKENNYEEL